MSWAFPPLPRASFRLIMADLPTRFAAGTQGRPQHYRRMSDRELKRLPVEDLAHPDGCWLFLWATSPKLPQMFAIADAWGFKYSSRAFVWIKTTSTSLHMGMGFTTRKNAEDCLLFRRGHPRRRACDVHEIIVAPVMEHSRKPDEAYERARRFAHGPYLDLFSRESRPGWENWGDEAGKFDEVAA